MLCMATGTHEQWTSTAHAMQYIHTIVHDSSFFSMKKQTVSPRAPQQHWILGMFALGATISEQTTNINLCTYSVTRPTGQTCSETSIFAPIACSCCYVQLVDRSWRFREPWQIYISSLPKMLAQLVRSSIAQQQSVPHMHEYMAHAMAWHAWLAGEMDTHAAHGWTRENRDR